MQTPTTIQIKSWTPEEEEVILKYIGQTTSAAQAFQLAAQELKDRTPGSISGHYYDMVKKNKNNKKSSAKRSYTRRDPEELNGHQNAVVIYDHNKKKNNLPVFDDTEIFDTIVMLIPKLNPGRKKELVAHIFPS